MRSAVRTYVTLKPRAEAVLVRLVAASEGWSLDRLEAVRHGIAATADLHRRAARAAGAGGEGIGADDREAAAAAAARLLDAVDGDVRRLEGAADGS